MVQTVLLMISKTSASWQCGGASENAPDRVAAKPANGEKNVPSDSDVLLRERSVTVKKSQGKGKKQRCPKILYRVYISLIEP